MKKILIFGASVASREILAIIQQINELRPTWDILGFVDNKPDFINKRIESYPVYGPSHGLSSKDTYAICGIMDPSIRKKVIEQEIESKGFKLASIIHPSVVLPKDFTAGPGAIIYPGVNISFGVNLGKAAFVFFNALLGHDLKAGDYLTVLPSATINGGCSIGNECLIGAAATLHPGVSIGSNSIVGIGTTLLENIGEKKIVMDLPRKIVRDNI